MMAGIELVSANVGVSFETIVLLLVGFGGLVFYAKDFKLGLILHVFFYGVLFMWFYVAGYSWQRPLILFFIFLTLLALSLYAVNKSQQNPYGVT